MKFHCNTSMLLNPLFYHQSVKPSTLQTVYSIVFLMQVCFLESLSAWNFKNLPTVA